MVLCFIALPIFAILAIFSAKYRRLTVESWKCLWTTLTLRPCEAGLDQRIRAKIAGPLFSASPKIGGFVFKHFSLLSWIFVVLMFASTAGVVWGGYNFYLYGNCNGPAADGFCVFDPANLNGASSTSTLAECSVGEKNPSSLFLDSFEPELFVSSALPWMTSEDTLTFVGCFNCPYTRKAWPLVYTASMKHNATIVFAHMALRDEDLPISFVLESVRGTPKYWELIDALFNTSINSTRTIEGLVAAAESVGISKAQVDAALASQEIKDVVLAQQVSLHTVGIYGTPTVIVDDEAYVGPKPARVYDRLAKSVSK
ncbi:MAG TPA: DsbA family protein [Acidobacteriota bacterium]|nr:DsbA family protein [Acidobacteriota bacterium]